MDFNHSNSLMVRQEENYVNWHHWEQDTLTNSLPCFSDTNNDLAPFPESLADQFHSLVPTAPISYDFYPTLPPFPESQFHNLVSTTLIPYDFYSTLPPFPESQFHNLVSTALIPYDFYSTYPHKEFQFDDIDLDIFAGECKSLPSSSYNGIINNTIPLSVVDDPNVLIDYSGVLIDHSANLWSRSCEGDDEGKEDQMVNRNHGRFRSKSTEISLEEIRAYFYMPITRAAKEMNVGLKLLKKRCRELGITRWPHRKMKSLKSLISNVQELGVGKCEESVQNELEMLEEQRRRMEENPQLQLTETTKKLRQFCFKANYKKRRGVMHPYLDHHNRHY